MPRPALDRSIGLLHATAMVVGIIIGASIFVQPTEVSRFVPSIPGIFAVWLLAGLLTLCGALVCAELSSAFPRTGGVYVFLKETISPVAGFLWVWAMLWSIHSGIIAATSMVLGRYLVLGDFQIKAVAIGAVWLLSAVNFIGVRQGSWLQTVVTTAKILAIAAILILVVTFGHKAVTESGVAVPSIRDFALAIGAGLFAFGGWHMVAYAAGETQEPERTIPRALLIGTLTVTACYLALNAACLYLLPLVRVIHSTRVAADAAGVLMGPKGATAISALVVLSAFGVLNGVILAGPRAYLAIAGEYRALAWMGAIHPRFRTPHVAILIQAVWSSVLVATGTYRVLFTRVVYTEWLFFALMTAGLLLARRRPGYEPVYRVWGYPVVPLLFIVASLGIVFSQIASDPKQAALGLLVVVLGYPVYYGWIRRSAV